MHSQIVFGIDDFATIGTFINKIVRKMIRFTMLANQVQMFLGVAAQFALFKLLAARLMSMNHFFNMLLTLFNELKQVKRSR